MVIVESTNPLKGMGAWGDIGIALMSGASQAMVKGVVSGL